MSFGRNIKSGIEIIRKFNPRFVAVQDKETYEKLKLELEIDKIKIGYGQEALIEAAIFDDVDCLVNAVVGSVGLVPTLKAIENKITIAIANKETLVTAGHLVTEYARKHQVDLLPVDSEHSAIFNVYKVKNQKI